MSSQSSLRRTANTVFGLGFDVIPDGRTRSGLRPAERGAADNLKLYADLRLEGFAALLRIGFAERLVLVGTDQTPYQDRGLAPFDQPQAIKKMLVVDFEINPDLIICLPSGSNTAGNMAAIKEWSSQNNLPLTEIAVVTNHYHLVRGGMYLENQGILVQELPAEAFLLIEDQSRKAELIARLDDGPFAERTVQEIQGVADLLCDTYKSRLESDSSFEGK